VLFLYREAKDQGIERQVFFNKKQILPEQICRYIKKSKKVANEDELLASLPNESDRPDHITYEDLIYPPHTLYHHSSYQGPTYVDVGESTSLNVQSEAVTPDRSRLPTPRSASSYRSSLSSFDMTQSELPGMDIDSSPYGSSENFAEDEPIARMQQNPSEDVVDDVTRRCAAVRHSPWLRQATREIVMGSDGENFSDASGYGYMSSTPVAMLHQPSLVTVEPVAHSGLPASKQASIPGAHVNGLNIEEQKCEATRFLGRCFHACICIGQSLEDGVDRKALVELADGAIDEAMEIYADMIVNKDGATLMAISILLTMFEVHGQLNLAQRLLWRTLEVSNENLGKDHALSSTINWMLAVSSRTSHLTHAYSAEKLEVVKVEIETYFGVGSYSALIAAYNFGWALLHEGQIERAGNVLFGLRYDCERVFGFRHVQTIITSVTLARAYYHNGDVTNAEMLIKEMIGRLNDVFPSFHPYRLEALSRQARFLKKLGKKDQAKAILLEVVAQRFSILGPSNPRSKSSLEELHKVIQSQGQVIDIKDLYRQVSDQCIKLESGGKLLAYLV
jgi:hypothetical protein